MSEPSRKVPAMTASARLHVQCRILADSVEEVGWQIGAHEAFRPIVLNDLR